MRYNIALLATEPKMSTNYAQTQFAEDAQGYLLSEDSLPHITVAQCKVEDENLIRSIWQEIHEQDLNIPQPYFLGIGMTKKAERLWGVSLIVARDPALVQLQSTIIGVLNRHNIECISPVGDWYRPHLTLARISAP